MPTIATTATRASDFEIGPELDPVWTQLMEVSELGVCKCLKRLVDLVGFEPTTSSMPWKRAPNCATGPYGICIANIAHAQRLHPAHNCPTQDDPETGLVFNAR